MSQFRCYEYMDISVTTRTRTFVVACFYSDQPDKLQCVVHTLEAVGNNIVGALNTWALLFQ